MPGVQVRTPNDNTINLRSRPITRNRPMIIGDVPDNVASNPFASLADNGSSNMNHGRTPLEILAAATTASITSDRDNHRLTETVPHSAKKSATPVISKNKRKAPSRSPEPKAPSEHCCICLTLPQPSDLALVNGCNHTFCFDCIDTWAERENTCPLCKHRFTKIDRVNKKPRRTKAEVAAKLPVCRNTKTVRNRNQTADHARIPIQDIIGETLVSKV